MTVLMSRDDLLEELFTLDRIKFKHELFDEDEYLIKPFETSIIYDENDYLFENWYDDYHDGIIRRSGGYWEDGWSIVEREIYSGRDSIRNDSKVHHTSGSVFRALEDLSRRNI